MKFLHLTAFSLLILLIFLSGIPQSSQAQTLNQAGLVVEFGDGSLYTDCIAFETDSISGYDLLVRSGLSLETAIDPSQGVAICKIEADGCPADDCFCQMPEYWAYWNLVDGNWSYAGSGSSTNHVGDGDVDGWSWGDGSPPPVLTFNQVCAPPEPPTHTFTVPPAPTETDTPEPEPSDTPEPEPTETMIPPTFTPEPSPTVTPPTLTPSSTILISSFTATSTGLNTPQTINKASEELTDPTPTEKIKNKTRVNSPTPTRTKKPPVKSTPKIKGEPKNNNSDLIGYAVFGALLIGLGLTLTRIILKGRKH